MPKSSLGDPVQLTFSPIYCSTKWGNQHKVKRAIALSSVRPLYHLESGPPKMPKMAPQGQQGGATASLSQPPRKDQNLCPDVEGDEWLPPADKLSEEL